VGVAGLVQSGGFGSFSKNYGLAAAGLLEVEVVTADGEARIANACTNPDLFWALKGGGGGTFGVVTRLTLRTRELPERFGGSSGRSGPARTRPSRYSRRASSSSTGTISSIPTGGRSVKRSRMNKSTLCVF
jgi:FAD/FMN-containing dehydrogenase